MKQNHANKHSSLLLTEILLGVLWIWLDGVRSWHPVGRADFPMHISEFECLEQSQSLVNRATHWQVIDSNLSQDSLWVDDEKTTKSNACSISILNENSIVLGNRLGHIRDERIAQATESSLLAWSVDPLQVGKVGVNGHSQNLHIELFEFSNSLTEGNNLSWANKCPIKRIEEQNHIFSLVVTELGGDKLPIDDSLSSEIRCCNNISKIN